jgi:hypothetical protein
MSCSTRDQEHLVPESLSCRHASSMLTAKPHSVGIPQSSPSQLYADGSAALSPGIPQLPPSQLLLSHTQSPPSQLSSFFAPRSASSSSPRSTTLPHIALCALRSLSRSQVATRSLFFSQIAPHPPNYTQVSGYWGQDAVGAPRSPVWTPAGRLPLASPCLHHAPRVGEHLCSHVSCASTCRRTLASLCSKTLADFHSFFGDSDHR